RKALEADRDLMYEGSVGVATCGPNIVVDTDEAGREVRWEATEICAIRFDRLNPCARGIMTTQHQITVSREVPNPMPAMGRIRMSADRRVRGVIFGWNAVPRGTGRIAIGDAVTIIEERPEGWPFKMRAAG
ncbi:MOSC domain-containing protein, partial [Rhizobium sp. SEMIA 4085]|uniref:MOSC domain-containing protein n=1 Tax=Rhizobium sp. SEMIA 4085 TaxID=2137761 RepID=UPI0014792C09